MSKTKVTPEQFKAELELQDRFATIFRTNGWDPVADKNVDINDALDIQNAAFMIPKAMTTIVQEGIEPMLIGTHLLQKIQYKPGMMTVFPAVEPLRAEETGDGMDLPIYNINIGGAQSFGVTVKRHGLRLKIAKRFVEESAYPWINFWLRLAGNALARHKEEYIFDFITKLGTLVFDNDPNSRSGQLPAAADQGRHDRPQLQGRAERLHDSGRRVRHVRGCVAERLRSRHASGPPDGVVDVGQGSCPP